MPVQDDHRVHRPQPPGCGDAPPTRRVRQAVRIDPARHRRVRRFFVRMILQMILFDVIFSLPVLRWVKPPAMPRWRQIARRYKEMAVEMGGVLIKLGQFVSTRVDLLPQDVLHELAGLQDRVAPAAFEYVVRQLETDFAGPLADTFPAFEPEPVGSASLAQAHPARLPDGTAVVVKVLRPGIDILVDTDLAVMKQVCRWLDRFEHVRRRMNLDQLMAEFTATTLKELDMLLEMKNLQRFAEVCRGDPYVYVPQGYDDYCAPNTLTLEDVAYIKVNDSASLAAWGIDRCRVASRLYDIYMKQIFVTNFIHVDPHPGNLFIRPMPCESEAETGVRAFAPGAVPVHCSNRPFQIAFIDFGNPGIEVHT